VAQRDHSTSEPDSDLRYVIARSYEAMSRLDGEAMVSLSDREVEFRSRVASAEDVTYCGHDGVRDYVASLAEAFEWVRTEPTEVILEGNRAVICNRFRARGRLSGVEIEERFYQAIEFRNGKSLRWEFHPTRAEALAASGMSEDAAPNLEVRKT
jgi:ketosteroid isomerase-like protein